MTFAEYYRQQFRTDIQRFMMSIPSGSRNHDHNKSVFTIQYERLTKDTPHLDVVAPEDRAHFAIALFLSVLVDEVCYTHFKSHYSRFRSLTLYPKFIGNCPGGCHYHFHPRDIITAVNYSRDGQNSARRPDVSVFALFDDASDVMKDEVFDFFTHHLPDVDPKVFWRRCVDEFPYRTKHNIGATNKSVDH